jgi:hypothetical protein
MLSFRFVCSNWQTPNSFGFLIIFSRVRDISKFFRILFWNDGPLVGMFFVVINFVLIKNTVCAQVRVLFFSFFFPFHAGWCPFLREVAEKEFNALLAKPENKVCFFSLKRDDGRVNSKKREKKKEKYKKTSDAFS